MPALTHVSTLTSGSSFPPTQGKGQISERSGWLVWVIVILFLACPGINSKCHHPFSWNIDANFIILMQERRQSQKHCQSIASPATIWRKEPEQQDACRGLFIRAAGAQRSQASNRLWWLCAVHTLICERKGQTTMPHQLQGKRNARRDSFPRTLV